LLIGHARPLVEGDAGDDVLFAEAAGVDSGDRDESPGSSLARIALMMVWALPSSSV
jgi:hypothetical protein